mgnify:FL=1
MLDTHAKYIGRFAPSPTGDLHLGTLIAAVASYLQARTRDGEWLLRIEDVDTLRRVDGASASILQTMEDFGFEWDGDIVYQSERTHLYEAALDRLQTAGHVFPCTCSRKLLRQTAKELNGIYPGNCRLRTFPFTEEHAIRMRVEDRIIEFDDQVMGHFRQNLATECGDFVIKRRDGLFAYQLAVVVDDEDQGITEVVRGADLLDSTPRQIYLQQHLGYAQPAYLHVPLLLEPDGRKLSKSEGADKLCTKNAPLNLHHALSHLGQQPPDELVRASVVECWQWALENWDIERIPKIY